MASYKKAKNLLSNRDTYSKYYGGFRGVDFSNDHTQVSENRFAYLVNMYKDYQSAQGQAVETIPGFRRRIEGLGGEVYGIHPFSYKDGNELKNVIIIHAGEKLYKWEDNVITSEDGLSETEQAPELITTQESGIKMNTRKSTSFIMNNRLYLIDGKNYIYIYRNVLDDAGKLIVKNVSDTGYVPTTHINITSDCDITECQYEQRNILVPKFKFTIALGKSELPSFQLPEKVSELDIKEVSLDGETLKHDINDGYTLTISSKGYVESINISVFLKKENSEVTVTVIRPTSMFFKDGEAVNGKDVITKCTIACVFDNRVFLSGNPDYPNHIFWCMLNSTGNPDPSYFGILNYQQDGVGNSPITGMIPIADALMVLKNDTQQDGSVYYHTPRLTGGNIYAKDYPVTPGLNGIGCLGACVNFLDDPVFVSRLGLEAVGQLSVRYERAIEHRSSLIDAKLVVLGEEELKNAVLEEWNGYLLLLVDGKIFMADSRQRYTHEIGVMQYEWYYLEDIGVYEKDESGVEKFHKAVTLKSINGNIFFGTENGVICSFNFDKRDTDGNIPTLLYTFDDRTIFCGAATKMDCCGIPHLTKNTVKKSTVIKTKAMTSSSVKVMVRTNDKPYQQIARINTNKLDFNDIDFENFTFLTEAETIFAIKEKEKKWVEKQYYVFSDEPCKPFALYYISYRYNVAGRIKK